ncbi:MAG: DUF4124 domain-containing protein [Proteobacteria bacterium]|nr:DUF4124 domain-containing protein [Pseudomonadota bacterium]
MSKTIATLILLACLVSATASADIWKWIDANGKMHFVDTLTPIYTWVDEAGKVYFSDTPDHEDAVSVELVWHATGKSLDEVTAKAGSQKKPGDTWAYAGETPDERYAREKAEAYYCKRAKDIYDSYLKAPRLYRTSESGEREYLTDEDSARTLAETQARVDELCNL